MQIGKQMREIESGIKRIKERGWRERERFFNCLGRKFLMFLYV